MPILSKEPDIFPDDLFSSPAINTHGDWWVLYTKSRCEKSLCRRLRKFEVPHFAPMIKRSTQSASGRYRESFVPLFPGYVFVLATEQQRYQALSTNCVSRCLPVPDSVQLVHDLHQIQKLVQSDVPLTPEERIEPGSRVRIRSGSLMGLEGFVQHRRGQRRLVVAIEFLHQGASVLIEDWQLEDLGS
ncbi:MAG: transcription termination/antitermination NusG family protein [Pirellulales bacterium]|jgi:transcription antitermination factor NusG|nr:transcription termination/antitermination NusG family protein [Pirellulales bacterium]HJN65595.1 transcription termination/antitermination NusG family protein [Pirellulales bacterium]